MVEILRTDGDLSDYQPDDSDDSSCEYDSDSDIDDDLFVYSTDEADGDNNNEGGRVDENNESQPGTSSSTIFWSKPNLILNPDTHHRLKGRLPCWPIFKLVVLN